MKMARKMIEDGFNQLVQGLTSALPKIITFLNQVLSVILQNAPTIITTLIQGIIQSLPLLARFYRRLYLLWSMESCYCYPLYYR